MKYCIGFELKTFYSFELNTYGINNLGFQDTGLNFANTDDKMCLL